MVWNGNAKVILLVFLLLLHYVSSFELEDCQVVIAGGTTASIAAAISSAQNKIKTCLLEPTDWIGGQLTASGVSAIDFAWENQKDPSTGKIYPISQYDSAKENLTPAFYDILFNLNHGDSGKCWVSKVCYLPKSLLKNGFAVYTQQLQDYLKIYYNTVVRRVHTQPTKNGKTKIASLEAIQRTPTTSTSCNGYDQFPSNDLMDWYDENPSTRFDKTVLHFEAPVFVDATEWGELLALSDAPYLQGIAERYDGDVSGEGGPDTCGQSAVYGIAQEFHDSPQPEPENPYPVHFPKYYTLGQFSWNQVWTYRRLYAPSGSAQAALGDITLQNWNGGNDFAFGYLFLSREKVKQDLQQDVWYGGVNITVMREMEWLAYGWHYAFKSFYNGSSVPVTLSKDVFGTCHGLTKLPYIRDTRRSVGIQNFVIRASDLSGIYPQNMTGTIFSDRVAIGTYSMDIHGINGCKYPSYMSQHNKTLPFFIPFRALTNVQISNLLVAGKTMAQSFLANSATRLHPIEFSSGTAAGVGAAFMVQQNVWDTEQVYTKYMSTLQKQISAVTPISWTIDGTRIPSEKIN